MLHHLAEDAYLLSIACHAGHFSRLLLPLSLDSYISSGQCLGQQSVGLCSGNGQSVAHVVVL